MQPNPRIITRHRIQHRPVPGKQRSSREGQPDTHEGHAKQSANNRCAFRAVELHPDLEHCDYGEDDDASKQGDEEDDAGAHQAEVLLLAIPACVEVSAAICGHHRRCYGNQLQRDEDPDREALVYWCVARLVLEDLLSRGGDSRSDQEAYQET
jgi:hypothetical protein